LVDEAHDLHHRTLTGLKRLMEVIRDGGGKLSIILAGHPKLKNDLKGPTMEEVGYRTIVVSLDAIQGNLREYVYWLLDNCTDDKTKPTDVIEEQAIDYLVERLTTPLQIEQHLSLALEEGFNVGVKPITVDVLDLTLSRRINDIEPRLIRHGYSEKVLVDQFHYKPAELRKFFKGELDANRVKEITQDLREAGLPI
ncbi:TPA: AAA family ATPase, partial [Escherichia coli]